MIDSMQIAHIVAAMVVFAACSRSVPHGEAGSPDATAEDDPPVARAMRAALVQSLAENGRVRSGRVRDAIGRVPRHRFVPDASLADAYGDWPLPIGGGQTISQPSIVGEMTEALELRGTERVLEIGTGSGYQAAILSLLAREVYTVEIVEELGVRAERRLFELGHRNVHVRIGDGYAGWIENAPFDRVILTAAPREIPKALLDQLAEGGVLVAPEGEQGKPQSLMRVRRTNGQLVWEELDVVRFVPMIRGR